MTIRSEFPEQFLGLLTPHRHKVAKGGRGGMKTYAYADALLIAGATQFERVLGARENMNSIAESVHHVLETRINALGLQSLYEVEKARILGPAWGKLGRTEFIFAGLRHNISNIKSLEGVTKLWVEEADNVSKDSWQTVIPTIRWEDKDAGRQSEIWVTYNPKLATDDTHKRFYLDPPPDTLLIETSYRDNPWLPEVLRIEAEYMRVNDPEAYRHVWLGECVTRVEGAIFADEMRAAEASGRIGLVPVDRTKPVYTFWDLGYGDPTAVWFAQPVDGWYNVVDFMDGHGMTIHDYVIALNQRGYVYGGHWLPWDGIDTMTHHKMAAGDKSRSIEQLMREACGSIPVRITPKMAISDQLNAARTIFPQVRIDREKCADGIKGLQHYQWPALSAAGAGPRKPLHNWASHPSSAFCNLAVSIRQPKAPQQPKPQPRPRSESAWA